MLANQPDGVLTCVLQVQDSVHYYVAFFTALLTVQILQLTHYSAAEFDPWRHALSREVCAQGVCLHSFLIMNAIRSTCTLIQLEMSV